MSFLNVKLPDTIAPAGLFVGGKIERMSSRKVLSDYLCKIDGLEVTELGDGGYHFAPPGDFSKVDFSACRELGESVNFDATQNQLPPKSGQVTCNIHSIIGGTTNKETSKQIAEAIAGRLSEATAYYGRPRIKATKEGESPRIDFEVEAKAGRAQTVTRVWVNGQLQPMFNKQDISPKTAKHSKQAKPAPLSRLVLASWHPSFLPSRSNQTHRIRQLASVSGPPCSRGTSWSSSNPLGSRSACRSQHSTDIGSTT